MHSHREQHQCLMRCESALFCEIEDRVAVECDTVRLRIGARSSVVVPLSWATFIGPRDSTRARVPLAGSTPRLSPAGPVTALAPLHRCSEGCSTATRAAEGSSECLDALGSEPCVKVSGKEPNLGPGNFQEGDASLEHETP